MNDQAFSADDSEFSRRDRFKARRQMIETMIRMGVQPKTVQFDTPRGAVNLSGLKALGRELLQRKEQNDE